MTPYLQKMPMSETEPTVEMIQQGIWAWQRNERATAAEDVRAIYVAMRRMEAPSAVVEAPEVLSKQWWIDRLKQQEVVTDRFAGVIQNAYGALWDKHPMESEMDMIRRVVAILWPVVKDLPAPKSAPYTVRERQLFSAAPPAQVPEAQPPNVQSADTQPEVTKRPDVLCWACGKDRHEHHIQFIDGRAYILCEAINWSWHSDMRATPPVAAPADPAERKAMESPDAPESPSQAQADL